MTDRPVSAGLATPARAVTGPASVGVALPVYGVRGAVAAGPAVPVILVTDADIAAGRYRVSAGPAIPIADVALDGRPVAAGAAQPVYLLGGPFGATPYQSEVLSIQPQALLGYWPGADLGNPVRDASGGGASGTATGVTFGAAGVGDGGTALGFDGSTSRVNVLAGRVASGFSGAAGTLATWLRVSAAGVWTDGTARYAAELTVNAQNRVSILRSTTNGTLTLAYRGGNVLKQVNIGSLSSTGWLHVALTWDVAADQVKAYIGGAQSGATQTTLTPLTGALTAALIGAQTTVPAAVWSGTLAHPALWNVALTAAEVAALASV